MTNHLIKDLAHQITEGIVHVAHDLAQNIIDITRTSGEKIENILKEKGVTVTRQKRHGRDCNNIIANSDGTFFTNNSIDFSRGLLNQVLFGDGGEERMSGAMSDHEPILKKVQNPQQKVAAIKAFQLAPTIKTN